MKNPTETQTSTATLPPEADTAPGSDLSPDPAQAPARSPDSGNDGNCPFYGYALANPRLFLWKGEERPFILMQTGGNQCAVVITSHSPCALELDGHAVDWKACPVLDRLSWRQGARTGGL